VTHTSRQTGAETERHRHTTRMHSRERTARRVRPSVHVPSTLLLLMWTQKSLCMQTQNRLPASLLRCLRSTRNVLGRPKTLSHTHQTTAPHRCSRLLASPLSPSTTTTLRGTLKRSMTKAPRAQTAMRLKKTTERRSALVHRGVRVRKASLDLLQTATVLQVPLSGANPREPSEALQRQSLVAAARDNVLCKEIAQAATGIYFTRMEEVDAESARFSTGLVPV
jgi:hypothetical protein